MNILTENTLKLIRNLQLLEVNKLYWYYTHKINLNEVTGTEEDSIGITIAKEAHSIFSEEYKFHFVTELKALLLISPEKSAIALFNYIARCPVNTFVLKILIQNEFPQTCSTHDVKFAFLLLAFLIEDDRKDLFQMIRNNITKSTKKWSIDEIEMLQILGFEI
jgi:hypothetical protein